MLKKAMPVHQIQGPPLGHNLLNYSEEKEAMYHPNSHDALVLDGGLQYLPQAPERSTSSRAAVQRGLNAWHQYGLVDDPFFGTNGSQQYFPFHKGSSWQEKERSMEAVNMYMFDSEPLHTHVLTSQSPMPSKNSSAFQPHFPQTLARPSYQPEPTHYNSTGGPSLCSSASLCQSSQRSSFAYPITPSSDLHDRMYQVPPEHSPILQQDCSIYGRSIATPSPTFSLPSTIKTQNGLPGTEVSYPQDLLGTFSGLQKNNQRSSSSPAPIILPKEPEGKSDEEMLNLEGLVAHRVAEYNARIRGISKSMSFQTERHRSHSFSGSHSRTVTPDEPMLTVRRRTTSDSQYLLNQNDGMCASLKSMRPEFVKQISVNSGRQPTGRPIQSYIESCRDMELAPQVPVHRSDSYSGLSKFPLSASGLEAHSLAEALEQQTSLEPRGYMASGVTEGLAHPDAHLKSAEKLLAPVCAFSSPHLDHSATGSFNQLGTVSGPIQPALISEPIIYLNPEEATVSIMGVHHIPGSPNTLHRTVATNTPPSPVLRQKFGGQRSPSLDQHLSPSGSDQKLPHKSHLKSSEKYEAQTWQSSSSLNRLGHGAPSVRFTPRTGSFSNNSEPDLSNHEENQAPNDVNRAHVPPSQTGIVSIYADGPPDITLNIKFVQDTSKFWYKPEISREQAICILKNREPGAFVIRDSNSFKGAYGLAMKIASPPPMVQLNKKVGDIANELVRHFLVESSSKGVRLKGCPNESYFGCLSALVYQHSITPLALPCKLMIPTRDPNEEALELATPGSSTIDLINQDVGLPKSPEAVYACNVLYINSVDMESLTGPQAVAKAITKTLAAASAVMATTVQFKMSTQGVTLTDNHRKVFFRRHYPVQYITSCNLDPQDRKWIKADGEAAKLFGLVARKQGSRSDNVTHVFADLEADKPVSAIVHFVSSVVLKTQKR